MYYAIDRSLSQGGSPSIKFNFRGGKNGLPLIEKLLKYEKNKEKRKEKHLFNDNSIFNDDHINYISKNNNSQYEDESPIHFSSSGYLSNTNMSMNSENEKTSKYCIGYEESPYDDWNNELNDSMYIYSNNSLQIFIQLTIFIIS